MGKVAFASFIGTAIEFYDFYIYGMAAALVLAGALFPQFSDTAGTLAAFATFAVAFFARPVGGVVFGHFGDRVGRKAMLIFSLLLMGVATFLIGLLPGYAAIGIWAPVLLVALRFLQGFDLGGEWGGAVLMPRSTPPRAGEVSTPASHIWGQRSVPALERALSHPYRLALGITVRLLGLADSVPVQRGSRRDRALRQGHDS
jgi:MFS transporter, MHS family, shikimate and dehydroshikimate transport protein